MSGGGFVIGRECPTTVARWAGGNAGFCVGVFVRDSVGDAGRELTRTAAGLVAGRSDGTSGSGGIDDDVCAGVGCGSGGTDGRGGGAVGWRVSRGFVVCRASRGGGAVGWRVSRGGGVVG